jgi:hypothetical protein
VAKPTETCPLLKIHEIHVGRQWLSLLNLPSSKDPQDPRDPRGQTVAKPTETCPLLKIHKIHEVHKIHRSTDPQSPQNQVRLLIS